MSRAFARSEVGLSNLALAPSIHKVSALTLCCPLPRTKLPTRSCGPCAVALACGGRVPPVIIVLAFVVAFVPALGWLVFIYFRDRYEREPVSLIARLFLWGLAAGPWASGMNIVIAHLFSPLAAQAQKDGAPLVAATWLLVLVALSALNEEVMKYVVCSSRVRGDPAFNEPADGMIYMSTVAVGFSAGENVVYILQTYFGAPDTATGSGVTGA
ncbi:MAG: PrsW family intramembrane metalloprotease, partial [Chloroflexi bacterium]